MDRDLAALKSCAETGDGSLLELAMQVRKIDVFYLKLPSTLMSLLLGQP